MRAIIFAWTMLFFLICAVPAATAASETNAVESVLPPALSLFGAESTNAYPLALVKPEGMIGRWLSVLRRHGEDDAFALSSDSMNLYVRDQWDTLSTKFSSMPQEQRLQAVSAFFNQIPGESDLIGYGKEHWAYPAEFLRKYRGDCKAYAAAKYLALRHLGWPKDKLWLVLVDDLPRKAGHAVLAVRLGERIFILDNLSRPKDLIMPHEKQASIYIPLLALNETTVWVFSGKFDK